MKEKLQNKLYVKHPELFIEKDCDMTKTCMCWGVCVNDGWFYLIDNLCDCITSYCKDNQKEIPRAVQVKEKFGELRFYTHGYEDSAIGGMIWFAEHLSNSICEFCGSTEDVFQTEDGWVETICKKCFEKRSR